MDRLPGSIWKSANQMHESTGSGSWIMALRAVL